MKPQYKLIHRDRKGHESIIGEFGQSKAAADSRLRSIVIEQKDIGAYHTTPEHEIFGVGRALWLDGSYTETWRVWE